MQQKDSDHVKTLVAHYKDPHTAQRVLEALLEAGFSGDDICLIVKDTQSAAEAEPFSPADGAGFGALVGALVGIGSALVPSIGPLIGSGPLAVAVTAGVGAAAGALTGGLTVNLFDLDSGAAETHDSLPGSGTLVSVTSNEDWLEWAQRIMARFQPIRIEERAAGWYTSPRYDDMPALTAENDSAQPMLSRTPSNSSIKRIKRVHIYDH